ncbi:MAG TPA: flagellar motor switch phosphatase FliY [Negativicutes bacterium]|nr:flagellar motor switch phosphatase FliY [Negativicutes bacterium]
MSNGFLSQEEIDSLLRGEVPGDGANEVASTAPAEEPLLSDVEKDALGELGNISMGSAATTLSVLLGRRVQITVPRIDTTNIAQLRTQYPLPYLVIEVAYSQGLRGANLLVVKEQDACIIADLMMGGDGQSPPEHLNELYLSAVGEAMNQMMGSTATSMSTVFNKRVDITPPNVNVFNFSDQQNIGSFSDEQESIVKVSFRMEVEGLIDSEIMQILSVDVAKGMVQNLMGAMNTPAPASAAAPPPTQPAATVPPVETPVAAGTPPVYGQTAAAPKPAHNVTVQPVQFAPLVPGMAAQSETNIDFIADVPLQITVELGRTRKLIREILDLVPGSVVELDKLAGEPVDVLVNGRLIAKGEVVVIDENFGVRVTDIIHPHERMKNIQ